MHVQIRDRAENTPGNNCIWGCSGARSSFVGVCQPLTHWGPASWFSLLHFSVVVVLTIMRPGAKTVHKIWQISVRMRGKRACISQCYFIYVTQFSGTTLKRFSCNCFCFLISCHLSLVLPDFSSMSHHIIWNRCILNTYAIPKGFPRLSLRRSWRMKVKQYDIFFRQ